MSTLEVFDFGLSSYSDVWEFQKARQQALIRKEVGPVLIICEHNPVITLGKSALPGNVLKTAQNLAELGVELYPVERGGDVTYHGPGQLVAYPVLDLSEHKKDVGWYLRSLEDVIIKTLQAFDITAIRYPKRTGVWTENLGGDRTNTGNKKIASIGVRLSRWCTLHGFSLNVRDCSEGFSLINPCGFKDIEVTSIQQESSIVYDVSTVTSILIKNFADVFQYKTIKISKPKTGDAEWLNPILP